MNFNRTFLAAILAAAGTLASCGGRSYGYAYGYNVPPPPAPPAYAGAYGVAPGPGYVWTDGYYDLRGDRWSWVQGRYLRPPHPHARWVSPRWEQTRHGWRRHSGYWR